MTWQLVYDVDDPRGSPWKSSLRDLVSNRAFSKFKALLSPSLLSHSHSPSHSHTDKSTLTHHLLSQPHQPTLTLKTCHRRQPRPTLTLSAPLMPTVAHPLTLSASPTPTQSHSPSHSLTHQPNLMPLSVTLSTLTQTPCHCLYCHSVSIISHSSTSPKEQRCIKWSSQSFEVLQSTRSLKKKKKKKVSPFMQNAKCVSPFSC